MSKTILLTGATGFIGSHVAERLIKEGYKVIILKRSLSNTWRIKHFLKETLTFDIDVVNLKEIFKNHSIDVIVHLATYYKKFHEFNDIEPMIKTNIEFPVKLLDLAKEFGVYNFINTGTFFEYSSEILPVQENIAKLKPFNLYTKTKIAFEVILKSYTEKFNIKAITFKIFSPYGPKDNENKLIPTVIKKALNGEEIYLSQGFQKLDFIYVRDIAEAYVKAVEYISTMEHSYEFINIASGFPYSIRDVVSTIEELLDYSIKKIWGAPSKQDIDIIFADITKAKTLLGWEPKYSLHAGLKETIEYYRRMLK